MLNTKHKLLKTQIQKHPNTAKTFIFPEHITVKSLLGNMKIK